MGLFLTLSMCWQSSSTLSLPFTTRNAVSALLQCRKQNPKVFPVWGSRGKQMFFIGVDGFSLENLWTSRASSLEIFCFDSIGKPLTKRSWSPKNCSRHVESSRHALQQEEEYKILKKNENLRNWSMR